LYALLGVEDDEQVRLARDLTRADRLWVRALVALRKRRDLSQAELGALMGRSQSVVSDIESMSGDPRLSTLRRYALAVGARVRHVIVPEPAFPVVTQTTTTGVSESPRTVTKSLAGKLAIQVTA
jgi:transcriptional regulator with XRE-family HTH domain